MKRIFSVTSQSVGSAALILVASALVSRVLGLLRDRLMAGTFGAGQELDIYFAAFRIPDFIYGLFITGGIAAVFLPVFSSYMEENKEKAREFVSSLLVSLLVFLSLLSVVLALAAPWIMRFVVPGFNEASMQTAVAMARLLFLSPILFGLASVFSGLLQYHRRFLAYATAPILYNLGIIFGILVFVPRFGVFGLAWGVILGALLQFVIQVVPVLQAGFSFTRVRNILSPGVMSVARLSIPRTIGAAAYHLNLIIMTSIASLFSAGSITVFNLANNLQYVPIGLVGVSFAVASFPELSRSAARGDEVGFARQFSSTLRQIVFLALPASLLLLLFRTQIVRLVLGTGEFSWEATQLTSQVLGIFALSVVFYSVIPFLARAFFARQDTKTPTVAGVISVGVNLGLAFLFAQMLSSVSIGGISDVRVLALPLALLVSGFVQFAMLVFFLQKGRRLYEGGWGVFCRMGIASAALVAVSLAGLRASFSFLDLGTFSGVLMQTTVVSLLAGASYLLVSWLLKIPEARRFGSILSKMRNVWA